MNNWQLAVAASAERKLGQLPEKFAAAIAEFMLGPLLQDSWKIGHPLQRELFGLYFERKGSYRVVYQIDVEARTVHVLRIGHRSDVYRPR